MYVCICMYLTQAKAEAEAKRKQAEEAAKQKAAAEAKVSIYLYIRHECCLLHSLTVSDGTRARRSVRRSGAVTCLLPGARPSHACCPVRGLGAGVSGGQETRRGHCVCCLALGPVDAASVL